MHSFSDLFGKILYMFWTGPLVMLVLLAVASDSQQN